MLNFKTGLADTKPAEKTNDPTPMSIKDVPQFSTFAKRLGKVRKSTARMTIHVTMIMAPLYAVMKGLIGNGSDVAGFSGRSSPFLVADGLASLLWDPEAEGSM